jgi:hypothetical protein
MLNNKEASMEATMTNKELMEATRSLDRLMQVEVPIGTSLQMLRLQKAFRPEVENVSKLRDDLITKYGTKNKDKPNMPANIDPNSPKWPEFSAEYGDLMNLTCTIKAEKISLLRSLNIKAQNLSGLLPFIELIGRDEKDAKKP